MARFEILAAIALTGLFSEGMALGCGPWYEAPAPTLDYYIKHVPSKSFLDLIRLAKKGRRPRDDFLFAQGLVLQRAGLLPEAVKAYQQLLDQFPNSALVPGPRYRLALALHDLKQNGQALLLLAALSNDQLPILYLTNAQGNTLPGLSPTYFRPKGNRIYYAVQSYPGASASQIRQTIDAVLNFAPPDALASLLNETDPKHDIFRQQRAHSGRGGGSRVPPRFLCRLAQCFFGDARRQGSLRKTLHIIPTKLQYMEIKRVGSQPSNKGPSDYFTGTVRIDPLFQAGTPARVSGASVTFEPGARTAWHTHPLGQTLVITAGSGHVQRAGGPIEDIHPGDVVWIPPGEKHWHGASATTFMTHLAIQELADGKAADWLEKVTDEQYASSR